MLQFQHLLAVILLAFPGSEVAVAYLPARHTQALRPALHQLAMRLEILDKRELNAPLPTSAYILEGSVNLADDLRLLRARLRELRHAPSIVDSHLLPDSTYCRCLMALNRSYRETLVRRQLLDTIHADDIGATIRETDLLYRAWDLACYAACESNYLTVRRQWLEELRGLIGPTAYYSGNMPPPVPLWRIPVWE
jgi:hypothetical protein